MQSHPCLSMEERSRLCRCLNYEKLSLEACKDLAKNPRIPPGVTVQALSSQHSKITTTQKEEYFVSESPISRRKSSTQMVVYSGSRDTPPQEAENDEMRVNLERMQWRVVELEKVCRDMKGQMSRMGKGRVLINAPAAHRALPRMC